MIHKLCCSSGLSTSANVEIAAPAETVWKTIIDLDAAPDIIHVVKLIRREGGGEGCQVGTKWREVRIYKGNDVVLRKTVTKMSEDPYSLSIAVSFSDNDEAMFQDASNTSNLAVEPLDESSCLLIGTFAIQNTGILATMYELFCGSCLIHDARQSFQVELDEYRVAAEKRQRKKVGSTS